MPVFAHAHLVVQSPIHELVRTAAGQGPLIEPAITVSRDDLARNYGECWKSANVQEESNGLFEVNANCTGIKRVDPQLVAVHEFAIVIGLSIFDVEQLPGIITGGCRAQGAQP